jgi:hypothetical protein
LSPGHILPWANSALTTSHGGPTIGVNRGRVTSSESCASPCTQSQPIRPRRVAVNPSPAQPSSSRPKSPHRTPVRGAGALHARAALLFPSPRGLVADDRRHRRAPPPSPPCSPGEGKARVIYPSSSSSSSEISASSGLTSVLLSSHADASRRWRTGSGRSPGPSATRRPPGCPGRRYSPRTLCLPCASVFRSRYRV